MKRRGVDHPVYGLIILQVGSQQAITDVLSRKNVHHALLEGHHGVDKDGYRCQRPLEIILQYVVKGLEARKHVMELEILIALLSKAPSLRELLKSQP